MNTPPLPFHYAATQDLPASPTAVFAWLDDPARLGAHMQRRTLMMAGSRMSFDTDALGGRATGSRIRLEGSVLGLRLFLEEVVTEHAPPRRKAWRTVGSPRLLVIGHYAMSVDIAPRESGSRLAIRIDYALPDGPWWLAGRLLGPLYARWCVRHMLADACGQLGAKRPCRDPLH